MNRYISRIHINKLFHLQDISIDIADENSPHLILTGKNGSGKTVLLNAIGEFLDIIKNDTDLNFLAWAKNIEMYKGLIAKHTEGSEEYIRAVSGLQANQEQNERIYGKVDVSFANGYGFIKEYKEGNFIIAFYKAVRKSDITEPKNPTKPTLTLQGDASHNLTSQLLNFLSDLKIQEALARNESLVEDADNIKGWFENFENILRQFFEDPELRLQFNYKDYTFTIHTNGKSFKFTELSDGFISILDMVADLILKMQAKGSLTTEFNTSGIVLIDEIESHLHLKLQKIILPMLTALFPNIQFIVTTHSPFVLSSLPNATAYDLEHQEPITNLTEYSYQSLTEGYFGVSTDSDYARMRYEQFAALLKKDNLTDTERMAARHLFEDYKKIPEASSPKLVGAYRQLEIIYNGKIKELLG